MATYLPADAGNTSPYQDGGGLYALGLIHANHGSQKMITYLIDQLKVSFLSWFKPHFKVLFGKECVFYVYLLVHYQGFNSKSFAAGRKSKKDAKKYFKNFFRRPQTK